MVKKISIFLIIAFMFFTLSACGTNNRRNLRSEIDALLAEYPEHAEELEALKAELDQYPHNVYRIAEKLETLKPILAGIYDGYIHVKIIDLTTEILIDKDIHFHQGDKLIDLIKVYFPVEEDEETMGLNAIANTFVDQNYQLYYYLNNELISNLNTTEYKSKDTLMIRSQNIANHSLTDILVDRVIYKFIRNHANKYFTKAPVLDLYVVSAIKLLEKRGYDVNLLNLSTNLKVEDYYRMKVYEVNSSGYVKTLVQDIINMTNFGLNPVSVVNRLRNVNGKLTTLLNNNVLLAFGVAKEPIVDVIEYLNAIDTFTFNTNSSDIASSALVALANYQNFYNYQALINRYTNYLKTKLTPNGIDHYGANCVATASTIIGLVANGISPTSDDWTYNGSNLIDALLQYEDEGQFSWTIDGEIDTAFSTPQGFAALVAYKVFRDFPTSQAKIFAPIE